MTDRRYLKELAASMGGYLILLACCVVILKTMHPTGLVQATVVLLPMPALCVVAWVIVRMIFRLDELQQRIQLQALAISVAGTSLVTLAWGFLETIGYPKMPTFAVWPLIAIFWMGASTIIGRRYRCPTG